MLFGVLRKEWEKGLSPRTSMAHDINKDCLRDRVSRSHSLH